MHVNRVVIVTVTLYAVTCYTGDGRYSRIRFLPMSLNSVNLFSCLTSWDPFYVPVLRLCLFLCLRLVPLVLCQRKICVPLCLLDDWIIKWLNVMWQSIILSSTWVCLNPRAVSRTCQNWFYQLDKIGVKGVDIWFFLICMEDSLI